MRKIVLSAATLFLVLPAISHAQEAEKKLRFGFNFGADKGIVIGEKSSSSKDLEFDNGYGLKLGIIMDYRVNEKFSIAPNVKLSFNNSKLSVIQSDGERVNVNVYPTLMELSTHFVHKFKGEKIRKYIFAGPSFKFPLKDKSKELQISKSDLALDYGIGADIRFSKFHFMPELSYSYGFLNVNSYEALKRINYHTISLVLNFM